MTGNYILFKLNLNTSTNFLTNLSEQPLRSIISNVTKTNGLVIKQKSNLEYKLKDVLQLFGGGGNKPVRKKIRDSYTESEVKKLVSVLVNIEQQYWLKKQKRK